MTPEIYNENNLPEYILGDSIQADPDQLWVVRLHAPRFVGRVDEHADGSASVTAIEWQDPPPDNPTETARLMREMGDWLAEEYQLQNLGEL